jgi:hypothetical protein
VLFITPLDVQLEQREPCPEVKTHFPLQPGFNHLKEEFKKEISESDAFRRRFATVPTFSEKLRLWFESKH